MYAMNVTGMAKTTNQVANTSINKIGTLKSSALRVVEYA
jgi:hypothetical protein